MLKYINPLTIFVAFVICAVPLVVLGIMQKKEVERKTAELCLAKGFEPNSYNIQTGKTSETVRFCVDSKGVMYWPGKLEGL